MNINVSQTFGSREHYAKSRNHIKLFFYPIDVYVCLFVSFTQPCYLDAPKVRAADL